MVKQRLSQYNYVLLANRNPGILEINRNLFWSIEMQADTISITSLLHFSVGKPELFNIQLLFHPERFKTMPFSTLSPFSHHLKKPI